MKTVNYLVGIKAAVPIIIGYLPVSAAFGVAGVAAGFFPWQIIMMSCLIFAGASQFILLASFAAGTPWLWVVGLCALMNARHLLYGPLIATLMPKSLRLRLSFAFTLTDEVFATALSRLKMVDTAQRSSWLGGLGLGAYFSWITGTAIGAYTGGALEQASPILAHAMQFSLPALFLALAWQCASKKLQWPLLMSAIAAGALALSGYASPAIIVGGFAGTFSYWMNSYRKTT
ncbi:MAG: AzlC family ABC transporter permease [Burkholderiales bacterium]|nr:AzlC family ABC transporter permease [Burkholderiales bacterium]